LVSGIPSFSPSSVSGVNTIFRPRILRMNMGIWICRFPLSVSLIVGMDRYP
jgi:hypothetical protein